MKLFDELDPDGNPVRVGFTLGLYYEIPEGHSIREYVPAPVVKPAPADTTLP